MADKLSHYGIPRRSGRYPWGSGENPYQRNKNFINYVDDLKKKGLSESKIAEGMGMNTSQLRAKRSIAKAEIRKSDVAQAKRLKDKGYSNVAIGERLGMNESSVRGLLDPTLQERSEITRVTADTLKRNVIQKGYIDVGVGVERHMGVSRTKLKTAIAMLEEEGFKIHHLNVDQLGTGNKTSLMVLASGDKSWSDVNANKANIKMVTDYSEDGGRSFLGLEKPVEINRDRIQVAFNEDGGGHKDGVIELRPGLDDISLGGSRYTQCRIGVEGDMFMKGMAVYRENMPPGIDVIYNVNKNRGTPDNKVFKPMKDDPDNPFGSTVRQRHYTDQSGNTHLSAINIVNEEGQWASWSRNLSSQFTSKQTPDLARKQLDLAFNIKAEEFEEIKSLTNPVVKKRLLDAFADEADSAAVSLKAAALPRQGNHVILPFPDMKDTEVYAPNYRDGEKVVLIRHPHGGIFEIPELTVNNKYPPAKKALGNAPDAIGINHRVAERLSGADFDGDTVIVIPNNNKTVKNSAPLRGLKDFDPRSSYPAYEGMPPMTNRTKQMQMGDVSNLITDMTIKGANTDEIAAAVRHSMVVIDAEKHNLNYKQSALDNRIPQLKEKYQGGKRAGASTLISKASSQQRVGVRKETIDPSTGRKVYTYTDETYVNKQGKTVRKTVSSTKMAEVDDARRLSSGTPMETVYANHANKLKATANEARKESLNTKTTSYSPSAKKTYAKEVASLDAKLNVALKNAPLERQAQILANAVVSKKRAANPHMDADGLKKIKGQALAEARSRTGAKKHQVTITDREWEAIQSGAISTNKLSQILNNTDLDSVKKLATPRSSTGLSPAKISKAKSMFDSGYTQAEVADALGVSINLIINVDELNP